MLRRVNRDQEEADSASPQGCSALSASSSSLGASFFEISDFLPGRFAVVFLESARR